MEWTYQQIFPSIGVDRNMLNSRYKCFERKDNNEADKFCWWQSYLEQLELKLTANAAKGFHSNEIDKMANNAFQEKKHVNSTN